MSALGRLARRIPYVRRPFVVKDELVRDREHQAARISLLEARTTELASVNAVLEADLTRCLPLETLIGDVRDSMLQRLGEVEAAQIQRLLLVAGNVAGMATRLDESRQSFRLRETAGTTVRVAQELYLDLLEATLTGTLWEDGSIDPFGDGTLTFDEAKRSVGFDWPATAATMIGTARMRNLRALVERVLVEDIPGDLIETGTWRGGACIYMRGLLAAAGDQTRRVFVADSFRGLPHPDGRSFPEDTGDTHHTYTALAVSKDEVEANFRRFGLLDDRVVFLEGWFKETLPHAPIDRLAILRLDGDMYESTIQALEALYGKVSRGGYVIIDDYGLAPCARAVEDFRARRDISDPLHHIDWTGAWWRVGAEPGGSLSRRRRTRTAGPGNDRQSA